ncbi:potassium/sodium hyperpolarization-activated cyclic nucleotide-gated channel 1-like [Tribolium madens]|uniref:potassium/sodium hyperpolarization-activated cyclic nucleotide-gated channel 1-like n=1 Tax=Tribolium madens TaxID=41895 RepID=UPI001CF73EE3|nr:potassium/sodium hyperpolarization-activated cyclic nucleotide-gated channel 1-like [Tribolium madens]
MTAGPPKYNKVFAHLGHDCEMLAEDDEVEKRFPQKTWCNQFKRAVMRSILVHEKICKSCAIHLRSHGAIEKEKQRHIRYHPTSIHPFSSARIWWELCMCGVCLFQLILVPLDIGFYAFEETMPFLHSTAFLTLRMALDLICCADIGFNAITGYYDEAKKEVVLHHQKIVLHYLKNQFIVDFLSSVPTHWDLFIPMDNSGGYKNWNLAILQLISTIKYLRFFTLNNLAMKLCNIFGVDFYVRHGVLMVLTMLIFWHTLSCTQIFGYYLFDDKKNYAAYKNTTAFKAISRSLYDGALLIYTASYGVEEPENNNEFLMTTVLWFLSKFVQIYLLARVIEFLRAKTSPKMKYSQMVKQLVEFMRHKQLPLYTQKRILTYYEFHFQKSYFRENEIYATISGQLRQEIVMQTCRQLVENVEFFRDLPLNLLVRIVSCLRSEIYLTNDVVVKANSTGNCMYFISTGTVAVYTVSGKEVCHLEDGDHFGEIALVTPEAQRVASVIAVETCELYRLDRKDFIKAIHPYPDLLEKIQKIAADRMEKTNLMEEHYKRDMATKRLY